MTLAEIPQGKIPKVYEVYVNRMTYQFIYFFKKAKIKET
jgi:hypothetical protein